MALSKPLVGRKPVKLINQVPHDLPLVDADENRLQQILLNLVGNSIKFTHEGEIRVTAQQIPPLPKEEPSSGLLQISVSDMRSAKR